MRSGLSERVRIVEAFFASCVVIAISACGGGSGGGGTPPPPQSFSVTVAAVGAGGSISPSSATVTAGGSASFILTPSAGYAIGAVTGCGGTLSGNTFATAAIQGDCTVSAGFAALGPIWKGGFDSINHAGSYGTQGQPAASNMPGERSFAVSWVDAGGNLWLFGGYGSDSTAAIGNLNDLWKYTSVSGEWTWVGGPNIANSTGVYGTLGHAAAANVPGARQGAIAWTDANGNFWLFGGYGYGATLPGYGSLADLWEYSPSTSQWSWQGGSTAIADPANAVGVYGTLGVAAATNFPGARESAVSWTDASGNFWLFGGFGYDSLGVYGDLNDLWEYAPSSEEWTWKGGCNIAACVGLFGTPGQTAPAYRPGARDSAVAWKDDNGNFWLFGGSGVDSHDISGTMNDLWKYSLTSGEWSLESGSQTFVTQTPGQAGVYGTRGVAAATNVPGSRFNGAVWVDASGNFWLFGGFGYDSTPSSNNPSLGDLNDLWTYNPSTREWAWEGGSDTIDAVGVYGTSGQPAAANVPGSRAGSLFWTDANGNFWLFGGNGFDSAGLEGALDDLWWIQASSAGSCSGFGCR